MPADAAQVIERPGDLTVSRLAAVPGTGPVTQFSVECIGTGQMSECYRITLGYADAAAAGPALHLDDGGHLHAVNIRIPGAPAFSIGYHQRPDSAVTELQGVASRESFGPNGLRLEAALAVDPGEIAAKVEVRGQAPVLLTAADGRAGQFPRVWGTIRTADGRGGVGWLEWNRNLAEQPG